jgi:hypothetical protein
MLYIRGRSGPGFNLSLVYETNQAMVKRKQTQGGTKYTAAVLERKALQVAMAAENHDIFMDCEDQDCKDAEWLELGLEPEITATLLQCDGISYGCAPDEDEPPSLA